MKLQEHEKGQGCRVSDERRAEIVHHCWHEVKSGKSQEQIRKDIGASKARVSRWVSEGLRLYGQYEDIHFVKQRNFTLEQTALARIAFDRPNKCWEWIGYIKPNGYGSLNYKGKAWQAHRLVYQIFFGEIDEDLVIDHLCKNKSCVNPNHLQPVPQTINLLRK